VCSLCRWLAIPKRGSLRQFNHVAIRVVEIHGTVTVAKVPPRLNSITECLQPGLEIIEGSKGNADCKVNMRSATATMNRSFSARLAGPQPEKTLPAQGKPNCRPVVAPALDDA
jgi:hypothetical protein